MKLKLSRFAAALLPVCFLSAQQPDPQTFQQPQPEGQPQPVPGGSHGPSPEAMRQIAEQWRSMREHTNAINDLAAHIHSPDDACKLVDLVAAEFSKELPPRWATRSIRSRIVRAEYESAYDPGALIPEQHVADAWNDYLQKIGAPQESYVTAAEIHTLRDTYYVTSQLSWVRGNQNVWTVPTSTPSARTAKSPMAAALSRCSTFSGSSPTSPSSSRAHASWSERASYGPTWSGIPRNRPRPVRKRATPPSEWYRRRQTQSNRLPSITCTITAPAPSTTPSKASSRICSQAEIGSTFDVRLIVAPNFSPWPPRSAFGSWGGSPAVMVASRPLPRVPIQFPRDRLPHHQRCQRFPRRPNCR